jgi:AP-4 complex subunit epsilon-1
LLVKRIGYLAASLFIDEESEMIILMISTIQKDLQSRNHLEILAALNCLSKLSNDNVMMAVSEFVYRLMEHQHEMIRKKTVMVLIKFHKIAPVEAIDTKMKKALCDKDPSVMACALNFFLDQVKKEPAKYKDLTNHFIVILKQIIDHRLPRDYDYHRIPAPWIQTKLLEILSYLGTDDETNSKLMYEIITTVLKRSDDSAINVGYALVYQCLRTITKIFPSQDLIDLATLTISRFLSSSSKNLKYMGIVGLIQIVRIDPKYTLDY